MKRISKIGVFQTSKVVAIIYFVISAIIFIPIGLLSTVVGADIGSNLPIAGGFFFFLAPVFYGIGTFIVTAIGCWIYNLFASWTGGIEVELESVGETWEE